MKMNIKSLLAIVLVSVLHGYGGIGPTFAAIPNPALANCTVNAYKVAGGIKASALGTAMMDSQGNYLLNIDGYSGVLLVKATGGTLWDAANGIMVPLSTPLWSVMVFPGNGQLPNISPLTDVVVREAAMLPGGLTAANVMKAISAVRNSIGIDPTSAVPLDPTDSSAASGDDASRAYGTYLAAVSQYLKDNPAKSLLGATGDFADAIGSGLFGTREIMKSMENFLASQNNRTGLNNANDLAALASGLGAQPAIAATPPAVSPNAIPVIQTENAKTALQGVTTDWRITRSAWRHEIEGYASATSVDRGESLDLYVNTIDPTYTVSFYRIGWYGGAGARLVAGPISLPGNIQPACPTAPDSRMIECDWTSSYTLAVPDNALDPTDWASGVYFAKLTGSSGKQNYITFVVRDDKHISDLLFQASVTTYQAYNSWGGASLYPNNSINYQPARKVSFNRPYSDRYGSGQFMWYEIEMVRFLEKEGYDVSYSTDIDTHNDGSKLLNHKAFLSVGHDEYWTRETRNHIQAARDSGVNLGFFGANAGYWQIRLEDSMVTLQPNRTMVAFKDLTPSLDPIYAIHPEMSTMLFRSAEINRPEAALVGVMYDYSPVNLGMVIKDCSGFICSGTGLSTGSLLPQHLLGYEVDRLDASSPAGIQVIANSPYTACVDLACSSRQTRYSQMTYYQAPGAAGVFAAGSMQWNFGFGMGGYAADSSVEVQQITRNVLNHFIGR